MTTEQNLKIQALCHCTFLPGSYQKRFVRAMGSKTPADDLTEKQAAYLDKLYWMYREQINYWRQSNSVYPEPTKPGAPKQLDMFGLIVSLPADSDGLNLCTRCHDRYVSAPATVCHVCSWQQMIADEC